MQQCLAFSSRCQACLPRASLRHVPFTPICRAASQTTLKPARLQENKQITATQAQDTVNNAPLFSLATTLGLLASAAPAWADAVVSDNPFNGVQSQSLYVTLALFLICVPGIWSQVKRAPKAAKTRKTFEVDGPAKVGTSGLDDRARQVFRYFKNYNYEVKETGEVITFLGMYAANKGQAAAVTFYTFVGLGSIALVLATVFPQVGNWWYALTLLSPGAWLYYFKEGTRVEEVKVKMVTADDEQTTDIIIEGDKEEIERFRKELSLMEKGKVYVKGLLE